MDAIADTVGGEVAAKLILKVKAERLLWVCLYIAGRHGGLKSDREDYPRMSAQA